MDQLQIDYGFIDRLKVFIYISSCCVLLCKWDLVSVSRHV